MKAITAEKCAIKMMELPRDTVMSEIEFRKERSIDFNFWEEVREIVCKKYEEQDKEQQRIEEYYNRELTEKQRYAVSLWVRDNVDNLVEAYKQIERNLISTRGTTAQTYWKYARRELNKARRAKA